MVNHFCLSVNNKLRNGCYTTITLAKLLIIAYQFLFLDLTQDIPKIGTFGIHLLLSVLALLKLIFIMKKAALILLSTCSLGAILHAQNSNSKINQLQVIGSHNSYRQALESDLYNLIAKRDTTNSYQGLQYEHIAITDQLYMGLRNLEIDVYADTIGGKYAHPKGLELVHSKIAYDPEEKDKDMLVLPHVLDITLTFTPIHSFTPNNSATKSPYIGISSWLNDETVLEETPPTTT